MTAAALALAGSGPTVTAEPRRDREDAIVLEAETLVGPEAAGDVISQPFASARSVLRLRAGSRLHLSIAAQPLRAIGLRVRARRCPAAARLGVAVAGRRAARGPLRSRWSRVSLDTPIPEGSHVLSLNLAHSAPQCAVLIDRVLLTPAAPAARATPPPPGRAPIPLGTAVTSAGVADPAYRDALIGHFDALTPENELKMEQVQPQRDRFDFAAADALLDFATSSHLAVRGHTLVYGEQVPAWVRAAASSREQVAAIMRRHIDTVVRRYRGRIHEWDVVNEAIAEDGSYRRNVWYDALGAGYVALAFQAANNADPAARLFYNDRGAETPGPKAEAVLRLVDKLRRDGVPISGVGLQLHATLASAPPEKLLIDTMRRFEAIGMEVQVTEMDVASFDPALQPAVRLARQAGAYRAAASACRRVGACTRFGVWGLADPYSWLGVGEQPLLLDALLATKPAYATVRDALATAP